MSQTETSFKGGYVHPSWDAIPPNLEDLTLALFKERFLRKNEDP